ncbi:hypothetical protein KY332_00200 [Candidatus Woesearchaeota archaeon]|nr:hypothetical protein [Candidatus Woesearchaeota archaeon]
MSLIVIGAKEGGIKVADHASSIDTLIGVDKSGNTRKMSFKPTSSNPGQETMQFIDGHFSDAEAFIIGLMQGPPNSKRKIVQESDKSVKDVIEEYKKGEKSYSKETSSSKEGETEYNVPKQDGSGKGTRDNMGRNPECAPEDYKEIGQGSGTSSGRAEEASPQRKAYNTAENTIDNLVEKYSNAKTDEQKEVITQAVGKYLKEASDKNLTGEDAEKYVADKLKQEGYSKDSKDNKNNKTSSSKKSSGESTSKKAA